MVAVPVRVERLVSFGQYENVKVAATTYIEDHGPIELAVRDLGERVERAATARETHVDITRGISVIIHKIDSERVAISHSSANGV